MTRRSSADYWRRREEAQRRKNIRDEAAYAKELERIYEEMRDRVENEINAFYGKYAAKNGITMAEARKRVAQADVDALARKAKRYVRERNFSARANEEMALYNLTMKVNRLELLRAQINLELTAGFDELDKLTREELLEQAEREFKRQAGILGEMPGNHAKRAEVIVNASFHNASFSERIWANQAELRSALDRLLAQSLIQGKGPVALARELRREFGVSRYEAERLMVTECARVRVEAAMQSYSTNGFTNYRYLAVGQNPCQDCLDLDGQVFAIKDASTGVNAPPLHPNCHCAISPEMDDAAYNSWLDSGAAGG